MENFLEALELMGIGLGTVFIVLLLVILLGNLLIFIVNRLFPEEEKPQVKSTNIATIAPNIAQAIAQAVQVATAGKGKVEKIEKL